MKSLEHIIREIREGKSEKGDKKSLEHSIRKVTSKEYESSYGAKDSKPIEEGIGVLGTDKYQGNEFKSIRTATPHIKPPAGEGSHSQAPENASRQRNIAKEKQGINRVEEAAALALPTMGAALTAGAAAYGAYKTGKALPDIWAAGKKGAESLSSKIDKVVNPAPEELERAQKAIQLKSVSAPVKDKPMAPPMPEVKPEPEKKKEEKQPAPPKVAEPTKAPEAPAAEKPAEVAAPAKPQVGAKVETPPKTATPAIPATPAATMPAATKPITTPVAVKPVSTPAAAPAVAAPATTATAAATSTPPGPGGGLGIIGSKSVSGGIAYDTLHKIPSKTGLGHAKKHKVHAESVEERKDIENMPRKGDRKSIEYVGRKDSDIKTSKEKTSRLATIKNVLDEAKKNLAVKQIKTEDGKTKVFDYGKDVLVINPDRDKVNLDFDNGEKTAKDYDNK